MKNYKRMVSLLLTTALAAMTPMQAFAENPDFAHDEATWARLRDNVMEYDELQMLVEEYNPTYMNNQVAYKDSKSTDNAETIRQDIEDSAEDMYDQASSYRDQADGLLSIADSLKNMTKNEMDAALGQMGIRGGVTSLMSAYSAMAAGAAMMDNKALSQQMSADSSYVDSDMRKLQYLKNQMGLIVSTQSMFNSYNQLNNSIPVIEKNVELLQRVEASTQTKLGSGSATQADLLLAKKNVQSLQSTYTESLSSLSSVKQNLCMMTGWQYDAQPEIQGVPASDLNRIAYMNPEVDKQAALTNNFDLQYNRRAYANMAEGSTDKKNMERTLKNTEENIVASLKNQYNDVLQKKTALELANAELATETTKMNAIERKRSIGSASELEYLQQQATFLGKQIDQKTADATLFQALQTYDWALKGYMSLQ